ncbi:hypothetical protein D3C80_1626660 [compost metagenome]
MVVGSDDRHYLHGDQHEGHPDHFYCSQCDEFLTSAHFFEKHDKRATLERAIGAITRWSKQPRRGVAARPLNAPNMLEAEAREQAAALEQSRAEFHRWLEHKKGKSTPTGDLAGDILGDKRFPVNVSSLGEAVSYLHSRSAASAAVETLRKAWKHFEAFQIRASKAQ